MSTFRVLIKKEFETLFFSRSFFIYGFSFLSISSCCFSYFFFNEAASSIAKWTEVLIFEMLVLILLFTMGAWADEKKNGTQEVLRSLPISEWQIILAKFLVILGITSLLSGLSFIPVFGMFKTLEWAAPASLFLALIFLAASFTAIGLWTSSLSAYRLPGFLFGFIIAWIFLNLRTDYLFNIFPALYFTLQDFDLYFHFQNIGRGVLDSRDLFYFLSFITFFLYLNFLLVKRNQYRPLYWGIFTSLLLVNLLLFNWITSSHFRRFDLSSHQKFTLSSTSRKILKNLRNPLTISIGSPQNLSPEQNLVSREIRSFLKEYQLHSPLPLLIQENEAENLSLNLFYEDQAQILPITQTDDFEYQLSSRLLKFAEIENKKISVFIANPRENLAPFTLLLKTLSNYYNLEIVDTEQEENVNDTASALLLLGSQPESEGLNYQLDQALLREVPLLIFADFNNTPNGHSSRLFELLQFYGIEFQKESSSLSSPLAELSILKQGEMESFFKNKKAPYTKTKKIEERNLDQRGFLSNTSQTKLLVVNSSQRVENSFLTRSPEDLSYLLNQIDSLTNNTPLLSLRKKTEMKSIFRTFKSEKEKTAFQYLSPIVPVLSFFGFGFVIFFLHRRHLHKIQLLYLENL